MKKVTLILALMIGSIVFAQDQNTAYETDALELVKKSNNSVETALEPIYETLAADKRENLKPKFNLSWMKCTRNSLKFIWKNLRTKISKAF